ncbi:MAG: polysaccharide biosynthesis C-terminal domain-containing protein, partial [Bacteroidetes bacterium]|nr:polysaccharide biosynthesis C-terminal domain-containing protein [Bacteroidota bacterium]
LLFKNSIVAAADLQGHPNYVLWMIAIIAVDNFNTLPFAKLRLENRPKKYAFARVAGILLNVSFVILFMGIIPAYLQKNPDSFIAPLHSETFGLGYYLAGNLFGSIITLFILSKEIKSVKPVFNFPLWREVMRYSYPLIIVGLGGMINDVLSRLIYRHVVDLPREQADHELGIFANIFRIALLITIIIQAFRMAAEPFFFNSSKNEDAQKIYARVMKFFVIACCFIFLAISLFLDVFKWIFLHFTNPAWAEGLEVVPLLAMGNIFLGIYYNLSIWYKLRNKNIYGAWITIIGAVITIVLNIILIPVLHYTGAAIATFACYYIMMILSYIFGQKFYPVPYEAKKLTGYLTASVLIYAVHLALNKLNPESITFSLGTGFLFFCLFFLFVFKKEANEIKGIFKRT